MRVIIIHSGAATAANFTPSVDKLIVARAIFGKYQFSNFGY